MSKERVSPDSSKKHASPGLTRPTASCYRTDAGWGLTLNVGDSRRYVKSYVTRRAVISVTVCIIDGYELLRQSDTARARAAQSYSNRSIFSIAASSPRSSTLTQRNICQAVTK
jgi:hypothetical protein